MKAEGAKSTAADGATEVHTLAGVGLVVSAFAFNRVIAERDALKEEWRLWQDQRVRLEKAAAELERIKALEPVATVMAHPTPSVSYSIRAIHGIPHGTPLIALESKT